MPPVPALILYFLVMAVTANTGQTEPGMYLPSWLMKNTRPAAVKGSRRPLVTDNANSVLSMENISPMMASAAAATQPANL